MINLFIGNGRGKTIMNKGRVGVGVGEWEREEVGERE